MKFYRIWHVLIAGAALYLPQTAHAEIHVAVAGPMNGQFAAFGDQMRAGAEQAVVDLNMAGGVLGEPLILDVVDDGCEETRATAAANQLIGRGVSMVVGHVCFGASVPASEVYSKAGIVQISPATTLPEFTDMRPGPGIYRLAPRDDAQAQAIGELLAEVLSGKNIVLLHDKSAYGKGLTDAVRAELNKRGQTETLYQGFDAGLNDYRILVSRLALEGADVVFLGGYHPEAGLIKLEMNRLGLKAVLIGGDALMLEAYRDVAGDAAEGTMFVYPEDPRDVAAADPVIKALEAREETAERYALAAYAAVQAWAAAAERAGETGFEAVTRALDGETLPTILGDVSFDGKGDANLPGFVIYEWRGGKPVRR